MKNKRVLTTKLSDIVNKYSANNVIYLLEREYKAYPVVKVPTNQIDDNKYLNKIKVNESQLTFLVNAYNKNLPLEPLIVRRKKEHYEIVVGRKRLFAARIAKAPECHAIVVDYSDEEMLLVLLMIARDEHNVNPLEMAVICSQLYKKYNYSQEELAKLTRQSRSQISSLMRILNLPDEVLNLLIKGKIKYGHARALVTLPENLAIELANRVVTEGLTVRDIENANKKYRGVENEDEIVNLENKYNAKITKTKNGLTIKFAKDTDFAAFIQKMLD